MMNHRIICTVVLLRLVFAVLIRTHKIELQDMNKLFNSSKVAVLEESTPVYLEQDSVQYDVHMMPTSVKGVYLPATYMSQLDTLIELAKETEVNAIVIDIKDDNGYLTFKSDNPALVGAVKDKPLISDIEKVMNKLYKAGI